MVQKISAILLLPVFLYNIIGFYFHHQIETDYLKSTVAERFHTEKDLVTLENIPSLQLQFVDEGKECIYKDEMYDIISLQENSGYYIIVAYHDVKETASRKAFSEKILENLPITSNPKNPNRNVKHQDVKVFISTFYNVQFLQCGILVYTNISYLCNVLSGFRSVIHPPPEF